MNFFKRISLIIVILVVLLFIVSFFLPSSLNVERQILIKSDREIVFGQINDLKNWSNWSTWAKKDGSIYANENNFSNPSAGVGAEFSWKSENEEVGEGFLKITDVVKNESVKYVVNFGMGETNSDFVFRGEEQETHLVWNFQMEFGFNPMVKFFGLFMEDYIKKDYDESLSNLKDYVENLPQIVSSKVEKIRFAEPQWFLSIRDTVDQLQANTIHGKLFEEVNAFMESNEVKSKLSPIVIYHFWSDSIVDVEAGIQLDDSIYSESKRVTLNKIDTGNVVTATHYGAYDRLPETYFSINEWMRRNSVEIIGAPWEVYVTDPSLEPNPDKWKTEIYFPIK